MQSYNRLQSKFGLFQLCTDFFVTDQDAILLRKVHPDTQEPATVFASIKCLKRNWTSNFFQITCLETSLTFPYFHTPEVSIDFGFCNPTRFQTRGPKVQKWMFLLLVHGDHFSSDFDFFSDEFLKKMFL
jgi:hypothetical protein